MALMTHLINVLKPFQDLTSSIDALKAVQGAIPALKDLEPAFQDMILFAEAMRNINDKVIHVSPARDRNTSLSLQAGDGNEGACSNVYLVWLGNNSSRQFPLQP